MTPALDADTLAYAGVSGQASAVRHGQVSARELVSLLLERIERLQPSLNCFSVVMAEGALAEAAARDEAQATGEETGPLHGVPIAVKEELDVAGQVTTFGGRANVTPAREDGAVVRRLRRAGAVIIGKTTMPEFGQWPFTESLRDGITHNPWDLGRTTGGSSGGSAAAVAAGLVPAAMGGDGGGSIRIPAACCGLFGLKPTRGRVSTAPAPHLWWSLGTVGPLTRSVLDSALVYDAIRGGAGGDRFVAPDCGSFVAACDLTRPRMSRQLRVGWSTKPVARGVRPCTEHVTAVEETAARLEALGHRVEEVDPHYPDPMAAFLPQFFAGVRYEADHTEHPERIEPSTRFVLKVGAWATEGVREAAIRRGVGLAERANSVFRKHDVLLTPTIAHRPRQVGALDNGTVRGALRAVPMIAYTPLWNATGHPAESVPVGFAADGLPLAVQLVGRLGDEPTLLWLAAQLERAHPWADAQPRL